MFTIPSVVHCDQVKYLWCPQYEGLGIKEILGFAQEHELMQLYLPDPRDFRKLPRQWLINMTFTLIGDSFAEWVNERVEARNHKLLEEANKAIELDPEIAKAFHAATSVSSKCIATIIF